MSHTPGPWEINVSKMEYKGNVSERTEIVAPQKNGNVRLIANMYGVALPEGQANAQLIAAAPELYEALENLFDLMVGDEISRDEGERRLQMVVNVLAKVRCAQGQGASNLVENTAMIINKVPDNEIPDLLHNPWTDCYRTSTGLSVIVSEDHDGNVPLLHMSVAHNDRLPTYHEMKTLRYELCEKAKYMAMIFPPEEEFKNVHPNCLHLFELRPDEIASLARFLCV